VSDAENAPLIAEAVTVATAADVVILALGDNEQTCRETWGAGQDHLGDRASLALPGSQMTLARAVLATGRPVVLYLMNGRPPELSELAASVPAILEGWYAGQATGTAVAEILFGRIAPSAKLCVSLPRDAGHLPAYYSRKNGAGDHRYLFSDNDACFAFGHGLSYSTFRYSELRISAPTLSPDGAITIETDVTNAGPMRATEVVQLYVSDEAASVTRPVRELKDFVRVGLNVGETHTVRFTLRADQLAFTGVDLKTVVEPGRHTVHVGGSSIAGERATFTVVPPSGAPVVKLA
jgi:beta-glucosidase